MYLRIWVCCSLLFAASFAFAQTDGTGLVLGFKADATVQLVSTTANARPAPQRAFAGLAWRIDAVAADGTELWSRSFPAPRRYHGSHDDAVSFSVSVPAVPAGSRLTMRNDRGSATWTGAIDAALLDRAKRAQVSLDRDLQKGYAATAELGARDASGELAARMAAGARSAVDGTIEGEAKRGVQQIPSIDDPLPSLPQQPHSEPKAAPHKAGEPLFNVGGSVIVNNIDVRVFDANTGAFVVSTRTNWTNSRFALRLPLGTYVFEVDNNRYRTSDPYFYRKPFRTAPVLVDRDIDIPQIPQASGFGTFAFTARLPCSMVASTDVYRPNITWSMSAEVESDDGTRIAWSNILRRVEYTPPAAGTAGEYCPAVYTFGLSPGRYSVTLALPGWEAIPFEVDVADGQSVAREHTYSMATRTLVWRPSVVDAMGASMSSYRIVSVDSADEQRYIDFLTSAGDAVEIAYSRGWTVEFQPTWLSRRTSAVKKRYVLDGTSAPSVVVLDDVAVENTMEDGLLRIHGDGIRNNRYNILFLAEGYTDISETYTDTNGNRMWDGIVWYDLNGDGVYNGAHDRASSYGNANQGQELGPDPSVWSEPFVDVNGDRMLNVEDPARFELNARDFMRSLLGADFWEEHRSAFNAYLFFEPSPQAGSDVTTAEGQFSVQRETLYGANLVQPRNLMQLDRVAAMNRALTVLPEVDMVVTLVNQTVRTLARGNVTVAQPGLMVWPSGLEYREVGDLGPSHEMGHYVGSLCDEYSEYSGVHPLHGTASIWCPNASYQHDATLVPWSNWLDSDVRPPSRHLDRSIGVFEGADYYTGGAYRPSFDSVMRGVSPLFNAPSRAALKAAVQERTNSRRSDADATGRCTRLPVNAIHRRDVEC